jgi:hypothetical protein
LVREAELTCRSIIALDAGYKLGEADMADKYGVLGADGQVEISKEILEQLGASPGWRFSQRIVKGRLEIYFFPPKHNRSLAGALRKYVDPALLAELDEQGEPDWAEIKEQAMIAMAEERIARMEEIERDRVSGYQRCRRLPDENAAGPS